MRLSIKRLPKLSALRGGVGAGLALATAFVLTTATTTASTTVTILKARRIFDGTHAVRGPISIRIEGDRIVEVGPDLPVPSAARVIDLGDSTVLPGLIDLHTHLTDRFGVHWEEALTTTTPPEAALWGARNARDTLLAGFTTCRDMGPSWPYTDVALRDAIAQGAVPGPRLLVAGNYVSSTGGAGDARQFSIYVDVPIVRNLADGPDEIVKAVRTNFKQGADFVKILVTGAVLSKGIDPGAQQYSDQEIAAAVTEATRWGRPVAAHAHGTAGIKAAIRAGVRTIDHGTMLDDEAVQLLQAASSRTFYVPTLYTGEVIQNQAQVPESEKERDRRIRERELRSFHLALQAGLEIGFGTDAGVVPHGDNAKELSSRVALGEKPLSALISATSLNARILGLADRMGRIEPGFLADLIGVRGDPSAQVRLLEQVGFVMKGGEIAKDEISSRP